MDDSWAEMVKLRVAHPMYTPDNRKLYPVYLYREDRRVQTKYVTPQAAAGIGMSLVDIFLHLEDVNAKT